MATTNKSMDARIVNLVKTTAEWAKITTVIQKGIFCIEKCTDGRVKAKIGDGVNTYAKLPYLADGNYKVDSSLSDTSTNPVQNKILKDELDKKMVNYRKVVYVNGTNGNDNNDGSSTSTAFKTLEKAMSYCEDSVGISIYLTAAGTYTMDRRYSIPSKYISISGSSSLTCDDIIIKGILDLNNCTVVLTRVTLDGTDSDISTAPIYLRGSTLVLADSKVIADKGDCAYLWRDASLICSNSSFEAADGATLSYVADLTGGSTGIFYRCTTTTGKTVRAGFGCTLNIDNGTDGNISYSKASGTNPNIFFGGKLITVDTSLSTTSNGPVANKTITTELNKKFYTSSKIVYVDSINGSDNNDGSTSAKAFKTLEKALTETANYMCVNIYFGVGTYTTPNNGALYTIRNRYIMFVGNSDSYTTDDDYNSNKGCTTKITGAFSLVNATIFTKFINHDSTNLSNSSTFVLGRNSYLYTGYCYINSGYTRCINCANSTLAINYTNFGPTGSFSNIKNVILLSYGSKASVIKSFIPQWTNGTSSSGSSELKRPVASVGASCTMNIVNDDSALPDSNYANFAATNNRSSGIITFNGQNYGRREQYSEILNKTIGSSETNIRTISTTVTNGYIQKSDCYNYIGYQKILARIFIPRLSSINETSLKAFLPKLGLSIIGKNNSKNICYNIPFLNHTNENSLAEYNYFVSSTVNTNSSKGYLLDFVFSVIDGALHIDFYATNCSSNYNAYNRYKESNSNNVSFSPLVYEYDSSIEDSSGAFTPENAKSYYRIDPSNSSCDIAPMMMNGGIIKIDFRIVNVTDSTALKGFPVGTKIKMYSTTCGTFTFNRDDTEIN